MISSYYLIGYRYMYYFTVKIDYTILYCIYIFYMKQSSISTTNPVRVTKFNISKLNSGNAIKRRSTTVVQISGGTVKFILAWIYIVTKQTDSIVVAEK